MIEAMRRVSKNRGLISLKDGYLYLANDGREFNRLGVISVCLSNMSSKDTDEDLRTLDEYDCEDEELISKLRHDAIEPYRKSKNALRAAAKAEINTITDYGSRWILEAIQNMDDALGGNDARASIGTKGRGFLSLMKIAEDVSIFSGPFNFCFSKERSILGLKNEGIEFKSDKIPYMSIPWEAQSDSVTKKLFSEGYATVIRLGISDPNIDEAIEDAENLDSRFLLFTKNISILDINIKDYKNTIERKINYLSNSTPFIKKEHIVLKKLLNGDKSENSYVKWSKDWKVDERKDANVSVCLEITKTGKYKISSGKIRKIYNYFPTEETINGNIFLNISLPLKSNRDYFTETDKNDFPDVYESLKEIIECICLDEDGRPEDVVRIFSEISLVNNYDRKKVNSRIHVDIINSVRNAKFIPSIVPGEKIAAVDARSWKAADLALCFDYTKLENTAKPKEPFNFLVGESINSLSVELEKLQIEEVDGDFIDSLFEYIETNGEDNVTLKNHSKKERELIHECLNEYLESYEFTENILTSKIFADGNGRPISLEQNKIYSTNRELVPKFLTSEKIRKETVTLTEKSKYRWNSKFSRFYIFSNPYYCLNYFHNNISNSSHEFLEYYLLISYMFFLENNKIFSDKFSIFKRTLKLPLSDDKWGSIETSVLDSSFGSTENEKKYLKYLSDNSNSQSTANFIKFKNILTKRFSELEGRSDSIDVKKESVKEFLFQVGVSINPIIKKLSLVRRDEIIYHLYGTGDYEHWSIYLEMWRGYVWCAEDFYIENLSIFLHGLSKQRVLDYLNDVNIEPAYYRKKVDGTNYWDPYSDRRSFLFYQLINTKCVHVKKSILHPSGKACLKDLIISDESVTPFASLSREDLLVHFGDDEKVNEFIEKYGISENLITALERMTKPDLESILSQAILNLSEYENPDPQLLNQIKTLCVALIITHHFFVFDSLPSYLQDNSISSSDGAKIFVNDLKLSRDQILNFCLKDKNLFIMSMEELISEIKEFGKKYEIDISEVMSRMRYPSYVPKLSDIIDYQVSCTELDLEASKEIFRPIAAKWPLFEALAKRASGTEVNFANFQRSFILCDYLALRVIVTSTAENNREDEIPTTYVTYKGNQYYTVEEFKRRLHTIIANETFSSRDKIASVSAVLLILRARDDDEIHQILRDEEIPENIIDRTTWDEIRNSSQNYEEEKSNDIAEEKNASESEVPVSDCASDTGSDSQSDSQNSSTPNSRSTRGASSNSNRSAPNRLRSGRAKNRGHLRASDETNRSKVPIYDDELPDNKSFGDQCERIVEALLKNSGYDDVNLLGEQNEGYDIEYKENGVTKFVEVKGLRKSWDSADIMVSRSQFEKAQIEKENFILHVIENGDSEDPAHPLSHTVIVNPAKYFTKLQLDSGWRDFNSYNEDLVPEVGIYLAPNKDQPEVRYKIESIQQSGRLIRITTSMHDGIIYQPSEMTLYPEDF